MSPKPVSDPNPLLPPPLDGRRWLKLSAVAALAGVHYQTAWRWLQAGLLPPPARFRRRVYFLADDVRKWLKRRPAA
jgi:predicted DNA-binding transcriptional regulator AlpA